MDPFATLGVERRYDVDLRALERTHRELSRALHPDRYATGTGEKREALSRAVAVNEAFRILRDPVKRAEALFSLAGIAVGEINEPKPGPALLMDVMDQREALSEAKEARSPERVGELGRSIEARARTVEGELTTAFSAADGDKDKLVPHLPKLGELRFYRRFLEEVSAIEDFLGEEG
jgi:molecular chaperone HscB